MDAPIALCATTAMEGMKGTMTIAGSTMSGVLQDARIMTMAKNNVDKVFIGKLRTNTKPIMFSLGGEEDAYVIPTPDAQLMYELSCVIRSFYFRRNRKLMQKR